MNSINSYYTFNYDQPDDYRFSHDSVFLARRVFQHYPESLKGTAGLDLCSGCGIVGLDFLFHLKANKRELPDSFDFLEVQNSYKSHFENNLNAFGCDLPNIQFLNHNYDELLSQTYRSKYDIILSNPPYFRTNQGILSPSQFKNRCRFFIDSDFRNLIEAIDNALTANGSAYILMKDLKNHGVNPIEEAKKILMGKRTITEIDDIRGTGLVLIK